MKKYIFPFIILSLFVLSHFASTDMKALTDNELNSITGQAGIKGFNAAFSATTDKDTTVIRSDRKVRKKVFDEVFVKKSEPDNSHPDITSFDEAFINGLGLDFTKGTEQKLKMNIKMEQISFNQVFTKGTVPNINFDRSYLNDKINNPIKRTRGGAKINFN